MKLKSFYEEKDTVNRTNNNLQIGKRFFTHSTSKRGLISKIHKELRKPNDPITDDNANEYKHAYIHFYYACLLRSMKWQA